ncbi:DUF6707 family protein [Pseudoglutamicibacter cumminsii]|uniref:DUF6707 family protein n=1 Tax=Pseudoglutamicibacter cumminsii TaxID=156979 RepID=UPI002ABCDDCC|nr:DUF6707 family protein [Pseudoglutamicibacter cumminsii]MDZ3744477.1 DUF6707 family protein [Pseudoglutamicibacter cumminsii]
MTVNFDGNFPRYRQAIPARDITKGDRFMRRSGMPSQPVRSATIVKDSFGTDAYVDVVLEDGTHATVAINSTIRVFTERDLGPGIDELSRFPLRTGPQRQRLLKRQRPIAKTTRC